jgi:orotate phosphoribosyltransferase
MRKHVLVIDDIFTTGATARAAAKTLLDAGAASVWVATLARARMRDQRRVNSARFDEAEGRTNVEGDQVLENPGFIVSHPSRKNEDAARVGHPEELQQASIFSSHDQSSF